MNLFKTGSFLFKKYLIFHTDKSQSDCIHEQVAEQTADVCFTSIV